MLSLLLVLMLQGPVQAECEEAGGYFKNAGQVCLAREDFNAHQFLLFTALRDSEQKLAQALLTQQEFTGVSVATRRDNFNSLIAALETKRDATSGRPAEVYQERIDRLTSERDRLHSTEVFDPLVPFSKDSVRTKVGRLGPVIVQLTQDIIDLKRDLDASI